MLTSFHDRRLVGRLLQLEDVDLAAAILVVVHHLDVAGLVLRQLGEHVRDGGALVLVVALDRPPDGRLGRDDRQDLQVGHEGDVVEREDVRRIGHGERQRVGRALDGKHLVLPGDLRWHEAKDAGIDVELRQRDGRDAVLSGQKAGELLLVDELQPDEDRSELLSGPLLFGERALQLFLLDEPFGDQEISQSPVHRLPQPDLPHLTFLRYSPQSLQCIRKGSVRIVLVEDEGDPFQAGVTGL